MSLYKLAVVGALSVLASALPAANVIDKSSGLLPVKQLFQFGKGSWLENLAVRSNGNILGTRLDVPEVYEFAAPDYSSARLVHAFPRALGLTGIVETRPDVFAVLAGNFSLQTVTAAPGSWSLWTLDLNDAAASSSSSSDHPSVTARNVANLTQLNLANGIAYLPRAASVLVGDSTPGAVWRVRLADGAIERVQADPLMAAMPSEGINGLKLFGSDTLFFDNSNTGSVDSVRIDPTTGKAAGKARKIATVDPKGYPAPDFNDDLVPSADGRFLYVAGAMGNTIIRFDVRTGAQRIVAGNLNSTEIAEPTAVAFGRRREDKDVLYAVTGGGQGAPINGTIVVGAQLVAIDLGGY